MSNLFTDPGFRTLGQENAAWVLQTHKGVHAEANALGGVVTISTKWTQGANWHVELIYGPMPVKAGERLGIAFEACAVKPMRFSVWLGQYHEPFNSLTSDQYHFGEETLPRTWERFMHRWVVERDEPAARVDFVMGRADNTLRLRNLQLKRLDAR